MKFPITYDLIQDVIGYKAYKTIMIMFMWQWKFRNNIHMIEFYLFRDIYVQFSQSNDMILKD